MEAFSTNTRLQDVDLVAWGQDFNLIKDNHIKTTTWTADKPYLVYNYAYVDSGEVLTVEPGAKIYFHNNFSLLTSIIFPNLAQSPLRSVFEIL